MSQKKRLLTIEDLVQFCKTHNFSNFSSDEVGYSIYVQNECDNLTFSESEDNTKLWLKCKAFHSGLNRNHSFIKKENVEKYMSTLKLQPILANIHKLESTGEYDFLAHDMEIVEENGEQRIEYIEKQVGSFTQEDPILEYDEERDVYFVVANAVIPREYTRAAEIIERKGGTKCSVELCVDKFAFNVEENALEIIDFNVSGLTLLGSYEENGDVIQVEEGMLGARCDIKDFAKENNSITSNYSTSDELVETLKGIKEALDCFNKNVGKEVDAMNEEIEVIVENSEDVVLEEAETEETQEETVIEESEIVEEVENNETETVEETEEVTLEIDEEQINNAIENKFANDENLLYTLGGLYKKFAVSHEDIRSALYNLISQFDRQDNDWYIIRNVYDDNFVMQGWCNNKIYGMKYAVDGETVVLDGDRWQLHEMLLTDSEKDSLEEMRTNYSVVLNENKMFKESKIKEQKEELIKDPSNTEFLETEVFAELVKVENENYIFTDKANEMSLDEFKKAVDSAFATCVRSKGTFSFAKENKSAHRVVSNGATVEKTNKRFGTLFKN